MSGFIPTGCSVNHGEDVRVALGEGGQQCPREWDEMRRCVALIPGWPREWTWSKIGFWKERGTRGRKIGVEMSPRKERSFVMEMDVMEKEDDFWREMTEGQ